MTKFFLGVLAFAGLLTACASPPRFDYVRDGATAFEKVNSLSECTYQIKLNKTLPAEQSNLLHLCMQAKGFRYKQVG
jgi:hypothetical protein